MANYPILPSATAGTSIKANWGRDIKYGIKALRPTLRDGQRVSTTPYGTKIEYDAVTSTTLQLSDADPFQVEWYYPDVTNPASGFWIIYLPRGCVTVSEDGLTKTSIPVNQDAQDGGGETIWQWYRLPDPQDEDATVSTFNGYVAKEWTVYVLMKPWPRFKATFSSEDDDFGTTAKSVAVATIGEVSFESSIWHGMIKLIADTSLMYSRSISDSFCIRYDMANEEKTTEPTISVSNQNMAVGRQTISIPEDTVITKSWEEAWLHITHDSTEVEMEVQNSGNDSNDDETWVLLYKLKDGVILQDTRSNIPNLDFYTSEPDSGN